MLSSLFQGRPLGEVNLLLVEDDDSIRPTLVECLELAGARVIAVASAAAARRALAAQLPDLIISDICMPHEDGCSLVASLRSDPRFLRLPAVALTANASEDGVRRALASGFTKVILKPFELRLLIAGIRDALVAA